MARRAARPALFTLAPGFGRGLWTRLRRWLGMLVVTLSVAGLTSLGEAAEALLAEAHPAPKLAVSCDDTCDEGCEDAGCHGDQHHCGCCASLAGVAPPAAWSPRALCATRDRPGPLALLGPPERAGPPPWQPPRA